MSDEAKSDQEPLPVLAQEVARIEEQLDRAELAPIEWISLRFELFEARMRYWEERGRLEFEEWQRLWRHLNA